MTSFSDRERAEEANFSRQEEMQFRIQARRNRLLGTWAAERMGLSAVETEAYAKAVVQADFNTIAVAAESRYKQIAQQNIDKTTREKEAAVRVMREKEAALRAAAALAAGLAGLFAGRRWARRSGT